MKRSFIHVFDCLYLRIFPLQSSHQHFQFLGNVSSFQVKIEGLCRELDHMGAVKESVALFGQQHPAVPMDQFKAKSTHSSNLLEKTAKRYEL